MLVLVEWENSKFKKLEAVRSHLADANQSALPPREKAASAFSGKGHTSPTS